MWDRCKNINFALSSMRYNGYAYLIINKLVTCQIIFYPNIRDIYELQLQKVINNVPKLKGRYSLAPFFDIDHLPTAINVNAFESYRSRL